MKEKHGTLLKNTVMLAILQLSTFALPFATVPYQTRILGPDVYGIVGAATAIMVYFQLFVDFGFLLSATEEVSTHREDRNHLRKILTGVTLNKLALALFSCGVLLVLCRVIPAWRGRTTLYFLFFLSTVLTSLMPDYLYRGLEQMTAITLRTVCIRAFFTAAVFLLLKKPSDIYIIPVLNIIGNGVAVVVAYWDLAKRFSIGFTRVTFSDIFSRLKSSATFFLSRFATTAYTAMNTVILDGISAGGSVTGYYTSADKLLTTGRNLLSPISDSLYPYMAKNRDFKLVKKLLLFAMPPIILFCSAVFFTAEWLCALVFGQAFAPTGQILRLMLPAAVFALPNYILGFPTLGAMGLSRYANYSVIFGSVFHILCLGILWLTNTISMLTLAALVSVTELMILLFRIVAIWKNKDKMRREQS